MDDYISREAVIDAVCRRCNYAFPEDEPCGDCLAKAAIMAVSAADVEPVRHGRWECVYDDNTGETDITCSHCKNTRTVNGCFASTDGKPCYFEDDFCPSCGAKMDLEERE